MKVLALVTDAYGSIGGIAQVNRDLMEALASADAATTIDILPRLVRRVPTPLPRGVRQHPPRFGRVSYAVRALTLALRLRPKIVYCGHLFMAPMAAVLARLLGAALVIHLHGVEIWRRPSVLQRAALEAADLVLCVSRDTRARAAGWARLEPDRLRVLSNTVAEAFTPGDQAAARAAFGVAADARVLLSVASLDREHRYKGQDRVIASLPALIARGHEVAYIVAGEGHDRARLEALALSEGVADHVRFIGHVAPERLPELYRAADLFVLPSAGEGFGIVFIEAMAAGTPALGLGAGGARDALEGLGGTVAASELTGALDRRLASPAPDPEMLSAAVRARFGRDVFRLQASRAFGRLARAA